MILRKMYSFWGSLGALDQHLLGLGDCMYGSDTHTGYMHVTYMCGFVHVDLISMKRSAGFWGVLRGRGTRSFACMMYGHMHHVMGICPGTLRAAAAAGWARAGTRSSARGSTETPMCGHVHTIRTGQGSQPLPRVIRLRVFISTATCRCCPVDAHLFAHL